jgi:hypothetical protein
VALLALALLITIGVGGPLAGSGLAQTSYPPSPAPDAGPIGEDDGTDTGAGTGPAPAVEVAEDPPEEPTQPPPAPLPLPQPGLVPAPPPSSEAPGADSCLGLGEADGAVIEILVRLDPAADDPVIVRLPDFPPDGVALDELVVVEAGSLLFAFVGECVSKGGGEGQRLDQDSVLQLEAGSTITLAGAGVFPSGEVATYLFSDPTLLGSAVASAEGVFRIEGLVDAATPLGPHVLQVTAVGDDGRAYRIAFGVTVVGPHGRVLSNLLDLGWMRLLALLVVLLAIGALIRRALRERHCILVGLHSDAALPIVPGVAAAASPPLPVASRGRRPTTATFRPGRTGLAPRDRSLFETDLRLVGEEVLDLDERPVPVARIVVVESDEVTVVLAVRRADGGYEPLEPRDGQLRAKVDGTLVLAVGGTPPGARIDVTLRGLEGERVIDEQRLARLRADDDGRAYARVPLPVLRDARPILVQVCVEGRRRRRPPVSGA